MSHLGSRLSALVDGQLDPASTESVLAHVAACPPCASELAAARAARRALAEAADDDTVPDPALAERLLAIAPVSPHDAGGLVAAPADPFTAAHGTGRGIPQHCALGGDVLRRRSPARAGVAALVGAGLGVVALFVLGDPTGVLPSGHPAPALAVLAGAPDPVPAAGVADPRVVGRPTAATVSQRTVADAGATTGAVDPSTAQLGWLRDNGWSGPDALPAGWTVAAVRVLDGDRLEVDLGTPAGPVVLLEQPGRLESEVLVGVQRRGDGYVLSRAPWHVVRQSGDVVLEVVAGRATPDLDRFVDGLPGGACGEGPSARVVRGWHRLTDGLLGS